MAASNNPKPWRAIFFILGIVRLQESPNSDELKRRELPKATIAATPPLEPALAPNEAGGVE